MDDSRKLGLNTVAGRFWAFVQRADSCWLWMGHTCRGYGYFGLAPGRKVRAHRLSWMLLRGPIPDGLWVLHNCPGGDNPRCVNPAHLWLGTALENRRDADAKGRTAVGDRHPSRTQPERRPRGEAHWKARLTAEQVNEIRGRYIPGRTKHGRVTRRQLATEYGISKRQIDNILGGQQWTHL